MPILDSGSRDRFVTVEQLTQGVGPSGRPVETWTVLTRIWMEKLPLQGRERFVSSQTSGATDTRWMAPYHPAIDPDKVDTVKNIRLVHGGRIHDVTSANLIGLRENIELYTLSKTDTRKE